MASEPTRHWSLLAPKVLDDRPTHPPSRCDRPDGSDVVTQRWLRSRARIKLGEVAGTVEDLKYLLHSDDLVPELRPMLYYDIGACYEAASDPDEAEYYYRRALSCDPDYEPARERLRALQTTVSLARGG